MKTDDCLFSPANSMEELSGISSLATCLISSFPACESRARSSWESYSITSLGQRDRDQRLGTDSLRPVFNKSVSRHQQFPSVGVTLGTHRAATQMHPSPLPQCRREPLCSLWIQKPAESSGNHHGKDSTIETRLGVLIPNSLLTRQ